MQETLENIERYQLGDIAAYEWLIRNEGPRLERFIATHLHCRDLLEDAFQETWIRVWESRGKLRNPESFRSWLYRIARNCVHDLIKGQNVKLNILFFGDIDDELMGVFDPDMTADKRIYLGEWREFVNREMGRLDRDAQEMLVLRYYGGLTLRQISKNLEHPLWHSLLDGSSVTECAEKKP